MSACSSLRDMSTTKRTTWTTLAGFKLVGVENAVRPVSECTLSDRRLNTRHCFASQFSSFPHCCARSTTQTILGMRIRPRMALCCKSRQTSSTRLCLGTQHRMLSFLTGASGRSTFARSTLECPTVQYLPWSFEY